MAPLNCADALRSPREPRRPAPCRGATRTRSAGTGRERSARTRTTVSPVSAEARPSATLALFAAALVLLPAPTAMAQYGTDSGQDDGSLSYVEDWRSLKSHLADGNVSDARATYQAVFAGPAENRTGSQADIEAGLDAAANASGPDATAYAVASQQVKKSLLPVAWANAQAAHDDGDGDRAVAWAEILAAKFGGDVADRVRTLENASTAQEREAALEDLGEAYRDVSLAKAWAETAETPPLLEDGNVGTAAKEAAEARWYFEGVRPVAEDALGTDGADALVGELDELVAFAEAGDADAAATEAGEIQEGLSELGLATLPDEKVEAWSELKTHLDEGDVDAAEAAYQDELAGEIEEYAPAAHDRILGAFDDARTAQADGDEATYEVHTQLVAKGVLDGATRVGLHELDESEVGEALEYLAIPADKFGWTADASGEAGLTLGQVSASNAAASPAVDGVRADLYEAYSAKVLSEADEVAINWDDAPTAREKAIEGVAYYHPLEPDVARKLDEAQAAQIARDLQALYNATTDRNRSQADALIDDVKTAIEDYRAAGSDASEVDRALDKVRRLLDTIHAEIVEYEEYKAQGEDEEAQVEIEESKSFLSQMRSTLDEHEDPLRTRDEAAYDDLQEHLDAIDQRLQSGENVTEIKGLTDDAAATLDALEAAADGSGGDAGDVVVRLGDPAPGAEDGTVRVPVVLAGVPADGYAFQASVGYDPAVVEVVDVEVPAEVGASTVEEGTVRFNAASTGTDGGTVTAATLVLRPLDGVETLSLNVTVEDLADGSGEPLQVQDVQDGDVDTASAASADVPAPGLAALALVAAAALGLAALRRPRR